MPHFILSYLIFLTYFILFHIITSYTVISYCYFISCHFVFLCFTGCFILGLIKKNYFVFFNLFEFLLQCHVFDHTYSVIFIIFSLFILTFPPSYVCHLLIFFIIAFIFTLYLLTSFTTILSYFISNQSSPLHSLSFISLLFHFIILFITILTSS